MNIHLSNIVLSHPLFGADGVPPKKERQSMSSPRSWRISRLLRGRRKVLGIGVATAVVAALVAVPMTGAVADEAAPASSQAQNVDATAKPVFKSPFKCGKKFYANNWDDHNPKNAVDFQSYNGDSTFKEPVKASAPGTVSLVRDLGGSSYGKYVVIDHIGGWQTLYAHLYSFNVKEGQKIKRGARIGLSGNSGGSQAPHLHYEQKLNGKVKTPVVDGTKIPYLKKKLVTSTNCGKGSGNPYTVKQVCGKTFKKVNSHALKYKGKKYGTVVLAHSAKHKQRCVVTLKAVKIGKKSATGANLQVKGNKTKVDRGKFSYYAGAVKTTAKKKCKWGGSVGPAKWRTKSFGKCL